MLATAVAGAFLILFASYTFNLDALSYVFQSADAFLRLSWGGAWHMFAALPNAAITIAALTALALYLLHRRSRYFGNTTPLIAAVLLLSMETTGVHAEPWIWALPFVLTFIGGVFADVLESRHRRIFLRLTGAILVTQAVLSIVGLRLLVT